MSIETRVVPCQGPLGPEESTTRAPPKSIKDLKDLRALRSRTDYRHSGPNGPEENEWRFFHRSAGACPPRSLRELPHTP